MTIHEHIARTRGICAAAAPGPWWPEDKGLCCPTLESVREKFGHDIRQIHAVMMPHPPLAFGGLCAITFSEAEGVGHSLDNRDFIAHARTMLPRYVKALEVAMNWVGPIHWNKAVGQVAAILEGTHAAD